jgi:hypothetical protein
MLAFYEVHYHLSMTVVNDRRPRVGPSGRLLGCGWTGTVALVHRVDLPAI